MYYFLRRDAFAFFLRGAALRRSAVTSISIFMRGSASPTTIMVAAGRTSPNAFPMAGQQRSKSDALVMR